MDARRARVKGRAGGGGGKSGSWVVQRRWGGDLAGLNCDGAMGPSMPIHLESSSKTFHNSSCSR